MKTGILALSLVLAGSAFAQNAPPPPSEPQTGQSDTMQTGRPADEMGTHNMKTQSYKGTLVDASCAMQESSMSSNAKPSADPSPATEADRSEPKPSGDADRSASEMMGQSCMVSGSTSQFALKTDDGRTLWFDSAGNQRAQDSLKNNKKWSEASSSGKPIKATVSGSLSGDKLTVSSIK